MAHDATSLKEGQYYTIEFPIDHEITVQRSRFIASLRVVKNRAEFDREMNEINRAFPKATHYCWAYRFNDRIPLEHSSDAGEPAGTAGRPILGALKKYSLLNIMGVVTRYYGGIKLGVKGLIAAYSLATIEAIEKATIAINEPKSIVKFATSYDLYNLILSRLEHCHIPPSSINAIFDVSISGEIIVPNSLLPSITLELENIASAKSTFSFLVSPFEA
ncbi:YigZ family protein [Synergistaceae bacterium OttesenSCG-928-I11]|nr:YigZ family protein [Synergistaceae bacterium OttesenSCG-928-I11]